MSTRSLLLDRDQLEAHFLLDKVPRNHLAMLDATEFLRLLPDNSIDLVVTDPAYESLEKHRAVGTTTRLKQSKSSSNTWFPIFRDDRYPEFLAELYRVMKPRTHVYIFCDETTADVLKPIAREAGFWVWKSLIWVKTVSSIQGLWKLFQNAMFDVKPKDDALAVTWRVQSHILPAAFRVLGTVAIANKLTRTGMGYHWRGSCERILMLEKRSTRQTWPRPKPTGQGRKLNDLAQKDVLYGVPLGKDGYPTEKPQSVIETLILNSSDHGQIVIDPFAGSGVVGAAATKHGRDFLLADIANASIETMTKRLSEDG